jgi:hypothetical protein
MSLFVAGKSRLWISELKNCKDEANPSESKIVIDQKVIKN